jgi:hypothetical protein
MERDLRLTSRKRPRRNAVTETRRLAEGARQTPALHGSRRLTACSWGGGTRTVPLVDGWASHMGRMLPLVRPLVAAGLRAVTFGAPGHGQSSGLLTGMIELDCLERKCVVAGAGVQQALVDFRRAATPSRAHAASGPPAQARQARSTEVAGNE